MKQEITVKRYSDLTALNVVEPRKTWERMKRVRDFCGRCNVSLYRREDGSLEVGEIDNLSLRSGADVWMYFV